MASRGRHGSMNFVAMRRVRRCGLRVAFFAHTQEFRCSAARTPLWATHCLRRIRMPKNFVALRCVPSDSPVSRSCKTYPVTQTKENKWTGEARLRPGKCKMRSRVFSWHLEGIWWNDDIGAEDYKKNDYDLSFTELKTTTRLCVTLRSTLFALLWMPR